MRHIILLRLWLSGCLMAVLAQAVEPGRVVSGSLWHATIQPGETITIYRTIAGHHDLISSLCATCPETPDKVSFSVSAVQAGGSVTVSLLTYAGTLLWSNTATLSEFSPGHPNGITPDTYGAAFHSPMTTPSGLFDGSGRFRADIKNESGSAMELLMTDGPNCHYFPSGESLGHIVSGWRSE